MVHERYKYFQVRPLNEPEVNGVILRVNGKKLEVYAGEAKELKDMGASISRGRLILNKKYLATRITTYGANNLRQDFESWKNMQAWAGGADEAMGFQTAAKVLGVRA